MTRKGRKHDISAKRSRTEMQFDAGLRQVKDHPIFAPLILRTSILIETDSRHHAPAHAHAVVTHHGWIHVRIAQPASPAQWARVLAHCVLHLGMNHFQPDRRWNLWQVACDVFVTRFLQTLRFGEPLPGCAENLLDVTFPTTDEDALYQHLLREGIPRELEGLGTAGPGTPDMVFPSARSSFPMPDASDWQKLFASGLAHGVREAVEVAAGIIPTLGPTKLMQTVAAQAKAWFISSYPLLGSLAANFKLIEDPRLCAAQQISIAAISAERQEIYLNQAAGLLESECRFVMAHELLHVGLRHDVRGQGRDPYLWNVACDYVINGWLIEMGIGEIPLFGGLYDPQLKGLSAESIYDRLVTDLRRYRKLTTLRGHGLGDILLPRQPGWHEHDQGIGLDDFYRRCLAEGLTYHEANGRGRLPAGLIEEIRSLAQPPIPWDVQLARWFDHRFAPLEKQRTYARLSRRQSSTPQIPRPRWIPPRGAEDERTFGVVLDTSGSMERTLLGKALGAIASYAATREVPAARLICCDAVAHDEGYLPPEALAGRVRLKGRGGTRLQPGIDALHQAEDFPEDGPILIITDGRCDRLRLPAQRDHAFLVPRGRHLPFPPRGPVFYVV